MDRNNSFAMCDEKMFTLDHNSDHVFLKFSSFRTVISSAVWNGGIVQARGILNMKVPKNSAILEAPEITLSKYCSARNLLALVCRISARHLLALSTVIASLSK